MMDDESGELMEPMEEVPLSAFGWWRGIGVVVSGARRVINRTVAIRRREFHARSSAMSRKKLLGKREGPYLTGSI